MVTQVEIARRVGLDVSSVNKILNRRQGPVFREDTVKKVFRIAKELGYDFGRLKYHHRRRHPRRPVAVGAELYIYRKDGSLHDQGVATIRDISLSGARISDVALPLGTFPAGAFSVALRPMQRPVEGLDLRGHVVRIHPLGVPAFGIQFKSLDDITLRKLRRVAKA